MYRKIKLYELLKSLSSAIDMVNPILANHHQQVAYLSLRLAEQINLPAARQKDVFFAALIHDIGILSVKEKLEIIENEGLNINYHGMTGAKIIQSFLPLANAAKIIKYHHINWENGQGQTFHNENVPIESHIVHLADRICASIKKDIFILEQVNDIYQKISDKSDAVFMPALEDAFKEIKDREYIWLDVISNDPSEKITNRAIFEESLLTIDDLIEIANIFSRIIDFRSRFTSVHSAGVAAVAERLSLLSGFSKKESKMMLIAGYLHDLGKLVIDNTILEKNGDLSGQEYRKIKSHTYYTYHLLNQIENFGDIKEWAAYHHERINGKGYPFHIKGENLSLGARIMAVADVYTAIKEDRPYRKSMEDKEVIKILNNMADQQGIDSSIVKLLIDNLQVFNSILADSEKEAKEQYRLFLNQ